MARAEQAAELAEFDEQYTATSTQQSNVHVTMSSVHLVNYIHIYCNNLLINTALYERICLSLLSVFFYSSHPLM